MTPPTTTQGVAVEVSLVRSLDVVVSIAGVRAIRAALAVDGRGRALSPLATAILFAASRSADGVPVRDLVTAIATSTGRTVNAAHVAVSTAARRLWRFGLVELHDHHETLTEKRSRLWSRDLRAAFRVHLFVRRISATTIGRTRLALALDRYRAQNATANRSERTKFCEPHRSSAPSTRAFFTPA